MRSCSPSQTHTHIGSVIQLDRRRYKGKVRVKVTYFRQPRPRAFLLVFVKKRHSRTHDAASRTGPAYPTRRGE